jgi:hypothetical protein
MSQFAQLGFEHEDIDYKSLRGLDRARLQKLVEGEWIYAHDIWSSSVRQESQKLALLAQFGDA